jgi:multimeric flavodoxin WrbA
MKVTVITGSPHKKGTSALLADKFIEGAKEAGHDVLRFDAAFEDVKPCLACDYCASHDGECVRRDAMNAWTDKLISSDMMVFVTPLYYYTMSAQIKAVIDRFHANNAKLVGNKKAMILATSYGADDWTMEGLEKTYESILRFMNWEDAGKLFATGCPVREMIEQSNFPTQAYGLGKSI